MTTEERLRRIIGYLGISVRQFEIQCGLGNGYVNNAPQMLSEKKPIGSFLGILVLIGNG